MEECAVSMEDNIAKTELHKNTDHQAKSVKSESILNIVPIKETPEKYKSRNRLQEEPSRKSPNNDNTHNKDQSSTLLTTPSKSAVKNSPSKVKSPVTKSSPATKLKSLSAPRSHDIKSFFQVLNIFIR